MPVTIRTRGPSRGKATMLETLELSRMQPIIGRKASSLVSGLFLDRLQVVREEQEDAEDRDSR